MSTLRPWNTTTRTPASRRDSPIITATGDVLRRGASKPGRTRDRFRAPPVRLHDLVQTSRAVAQTGGRLAKIELLATLLKRAAPDEIETVIAFLSGSPRQGRIGVGYAALQAARAALTPLPPLHGVERG